MTDTMSYEERMAIRYSDMMIGMSKSMLMTFFEMVEIDPLLACTNVWDMLWEYMKRYGGQSMRRTGLGRTVKAAIQENIHPGKVTIADAKYKEEEE